MPEHLINIVHDMICKCQPIIGCVKEKLQLSHYVPQENTFKNGVHNRINIFESSPKG